MSDDPECHSAPDRGRWMVAAGRVPIGSGRSPWIADPPKNPFAPAGAKVSIARPRSCSGRVALWSLSADRPVPSPSPSGGGGRDLHPSPSSSSSSSRAGFSRRGSFPCTAADVAVVSADRRGMPIGCSNRGATGLFFFFFLFLVATADRPPRSEYWQGSHCGSPPRQLQPGLSPVPPRGGCGLWTVGQRHGRFSCTGARTARGAVWRWNMVGGCGTNCELRTANCEWRALPADGG